VIVRADLRIGLVAPAIVANSHADNVLAPEEGRRLLESIAIGDPVGLRDRALIVLMPNASRGSRPRRA
jgi:hypothetical protein